MTEGFIVLNGQHVSAILHGSEGYKEDPHAKEWGFVDTKKKRPHQESFQKDKHCPPCGAWKQTLPSPADAE